MNVLVIGGTGFIGSNICKRFVQEGHRVTVFGPDMQTNMLNEIKDEIAYRQGDILDPMSLFGAFLDVKPDVVINLAAFGAGAKGLAKSANEWPRKALEVNIIGFHNVVETARMLKVPKLIWSSSSTVYGPYKLYSGKVNEMSAVHPVTFYGSTKVMEELISKFYRNQFDMEISGVRLPLVYGPGRWYKGAGAAIVDLFEGGLNTVIYGGEEQMDLMYVKDVAKLFLEMAITTRPLSDIYNVKSHQTSLQELIETVRSLSPKRQIEWKKTKSPVIYPIMDTTKIEDELGFYPSFSVEKACRDYLNEVGELHEC